MVFTWLGFQNRKLNRMKRSKNEGLAFVQSIWNFCLGNWNATKLHLSIIFVRCLACFLSVLENSFDDVKKRGFNCSKNAGFRVRFTDFALLGGVLDAVLFCGWTSEFQFLLDINYNTTSRWLFHIKLILLPQDGAR